MIACQPLATSFPPISIISINHPLIFSYEAELTEKLVHVCMPLLQTFSPSRNKIRFLCTCLVPREKIISNHEDGTTVRPNHIIFIENSAEILYASGDVRIMTSS